MVPRWRTAVVVALATLLACVALAPAARADGDPGSDVLVYQTLFLGSDAGVPDAQQEQLAGVLNAAARARFPIRVALIASPADLGAITELWRAPRQYAHFLDLELSDTYGGRLLVVMPNGFGYYWEGRPTATAYGVLDRIPIRADHGGLATAAERAVRALARADGIALPKSPSAAGAPARSGLASPSTSLSPPAHGSGAPVGLIVLGAVLALLAVAALILRRRLGTALLASLGRLRRAAGGGRVARFRVPLAATVVSFGGLAALALALSASGSATNQGAALAANPALDPGTALHGMAPDFTLSDQLGEPVSLHSFRGRVVILAFNDAECTTVCPLTTTAMLDAKSMLGAAGSRVQLLGVDANPKATAIEDVLSYSQVHGMLDAWQFLTGSLPALQRVWTAYSIDVAINQRTIDHTPAIFVIDPQGRLAKLYVTQPYYSAVGQLGQILATEVSSLLPGHPRVNSHLSYQTIPGTSPATTVEVDRSEGGSIAVGPRGAPRLYLFFATWDQEITGLAVELHALNAYQRQAMSSGLPKLTAVDEASVEPPGALGAFMAPLKLAYPVALDRTGQLADGYEVQGQPWFVLVSADGQIAWYWQVASSGWLSTSALIKQVHDALAKAPHSPTSPAAVQAELAGSPAPLAALHRQSSQLLGSASGLFARIHALRGYPIVVNIWASWCQPCQAEFGLFANASALYGRDVAFLGADYTDTSPGDARAFLRQHFVSYPSYQASNGQLNQIAIVANLPMTVFIGPTGKVLYRHIGQYDTQGALDGDIASYAGR